VKEDSIYLDYNATTPVDPRVLEEMMPFFTSSYANPASSHFAGRKIKDSIEKARSQVAYLIGANPKEIVFTSGATEAINLALKGVFENTGSGKNHLITVSTEHKAVLDTCLYLESRGVDVTYLPVNSAGLVDLEQLEAAIKKETKLISVMYANNETGVIQPIKEIGQLAKKYKVLFFSDATQAVGKLDLDVEELGVDMLCISGHKLYGPKGIGALFLNKRSTQERLTPQLHGGGHEYGFRSGTLNAPGIIGLGKACEIAKEDLINEYQKSICILRDKLQTELLKIPNTRVNGSNKNRLFNTVNLCFPGQDASVMIERLKNIAVSTGSACSSSLIEPSHVLKAMGLPDEESYASIRFSLGKLSTIFEIDEALYHLKMILK
jgi:cysteine desulfurase